MKKRIIKIAASVIVLLLFVACGGDRHKARVSVTVENPFKTFRDVPGITPGEIAAIEALQREREFFTYGRVPSIEAFLQENGEYGGFSTLVCEWLTGLFAITFKPVIENNFSDLISGLEAHTIDFLGNVTVTEERLKKYHMTDTIAERQLKMMRLRGSPTIEHIAQERPPRFAFLRNSNNGVMAMASMTPGSYEAVFVNNPAEAHEALLSGTADAYVETNNTVDVYFAADVYTELFFPLIFDPVSLTTANPKLELVISIVNKALRGGAIHYVNRLNNLGLEAFKIERFRSQLTVEERAYLRRTSTVPLATRYFNYPIDFFNAYERKWEGIIFDVLVEIEKFTGLKFEVVNDEHTEFSDLLEMLYNGRAHILPDVTYSERREGQLLWAKNNFLLNQYALLSRGGYPNISLNEISYARVGLIASTASAELFRTWFPSASNIREYDSDESAFRALDQGEVDMVMASKNRLLSIVNYYEFSDFKAIYLFTYTYSSFVFNKNEGVLCSIVDKALPLIDTNTIVEQWMTKTYDYRTKVAEGRLPWFIGAIVLSVIVLALILFVLYRTRNEGKRLATQVTIKTKQAMEASEAKSRFIANMSHEMRTPMNSIIGFSELAINNADPVKTKEYLDKILINSELLLQIIDDVLDISKIETGGMELENAPFDMHDLLTASQTMIAPKAREKEVNLYFYAEPSIGKKLIGDSLRLRQVLVNLLSNAVKFTGRNGMVKVSATVVELDGARHQSANECQAPNREKVPGTESRKGAWHRIRYRTL
jgi:signal transduction histidine kinase